MTSVGIALGEIGLFYGLVFATIWLGQVISFRPPSLLAAALILGVCIFSNRRHGDSLEKIGLAKANFIPCLRLAVKALAVPVLALAAWAALQPMPTVERLLYGTKGLPSSLQAWPWPVILLLGLLRYPLWAFAQEYALLSFLGNRWKDALGERPWTVALVNGFLFSLAHAPNPILMSVCLVSGVAFTRIFLKTPHLVPLVLIHAAAGLLLSLIYQDYYPAMMVGPAYLKYSQGREMDFLHLSSVFN